MRTQTYTQMLKEYGEGYWDPGDEMERNETLPKYNYSLIVEGEYMELDNLNKWIKKNIGEDYGETIYYSKTGYDFCFIEIFSNHSDYIFKIEEAVPRIYSTYPNAHPKPLIERSVGYDDHVKYKEGDEDAIVM
jgi:hypothetical protein